MEHFESIQTSSFHVLFHHLHIAPCNATLLGQWKTKSTLVDYGVETDPGCKSQHVITLGDGLIWVEWKWSPLRPLKALGRVCLLTY